jgi:dCMP deaminase
VNKQLKLDKKYIELAESWSQLSVAERMKVGCIIVKDNQIISDGFNGTPSGFDNKCEDEHFKTIPEVLHAESNALMKLALSTQSSKDAILYVTLSPCFECSKLIIQAKIKRVVYRDDYRILSGLDLLRKANVIVERIDK